MADQMLKRAWHSGRVPPPVGENARDAECIGTCVICGGRYSEGDRIADLYGSTYVAHVRCFGSADG